MKPSRFPYPLLALAALALALPGPARAAAPPLDMDEEEAQAPSVLTPVLALAQTAIFSPRKITTLLNPPSPIAIPQQAQPPEPAPPEEEMPTDPPPQLQDVPEPASVVTGLVGAGIFAWWRTRRRRKAKGPAETVTPLPR